MTLDPETERALRNRLRPMESDLFAAKALDAVARNRDLIVIPGWWRAFRMLNAVSPGLGEALALRKYRKARELLLQGTSSPGEGRKDTS